MSLDAQKQEIHIQMNATNLDDPEEDLDGLEGPR